jgi:ubiquinone/menaquinone biosynthesis C-methylase UbiE
MVEASWLMTDATTEQSEFWSTVARKYDDVVDAQLGGATRAMVRERVLKEDRLGNLAEFGCGTGYYTAVLAEKASNVVATDVSPGMLALARERVKAPNVTFQGEDCEKTSLAAASFDTAFMSLLIHFTEPARTLEEMRRILKPGGTLIVVNLDPQALGGLNRLRSLLRVLYRGITGYRLKPPKRFGANVMSGQQLGELLRKSGFRVIGMDTIRDGSRPSSIPVEYVRAVKI